MQMLLFILYTTQIILFQPKVTKPWRHTYSEVKQTDPYSSGEQHREVRGIVEFRFVIRFSQFHLSIFGEVKDQDKEGPSVLRADIHPCKRVCYPHLALAHLLVCRLGLYHAPDHKSPYQDRRDEGDDWVEAKVDAKLEFPYLSPFPLDSEPATLV